MSKLGTLLTASSCVYVPVDDPKKELLEEIAEVSKGKMEKNRNCWVKDQTISVFFLVKTSLNHLCYFF